MIQIHTKKQLHKEYISTAKRSWKLLLLSLCALGGIVYLVFMIDPARSVSFASFPLPIVPSFFALLFLFLFGFSAFLFKSKIHGILLASLTVVYLVFRQNDLTHPFFAVLLLALFLVLELMFTYKK